ncbi:hypothetical protein Baya_15944 [Bagarius yarrelli]|uniref:Uncharacterized protein n=1 Tax=Bagarius yarrelli TaxID=175774 RepID=A0A556VTY7_BAGYA|nr:hypothetical protein Baya_15944 [Bagarius yarrelli]
MGTEHRAPKIRNGTQNIENRVPTAERQKQGTDRRKPSTQHRAQSNRIDYRAQSNENRVHSFTECHSSGTKTSAESFFTQQHHKESKSRAELKLKPIIEAARCREQPKKSRVPSTEQ